MVDEKNRWCLAQIAFLMMKDEHEKAEGSMEKKW